MLFRSKVEAGETNAAPVKTDTRTSDTGKIVLGGGFRLPVRGA